MDEKVYPYVEPPKSAKKDKKEKKPNKGAEKMTSADGEHDMLENARIIVYCVGGLSHHEMCSIADL
jgi:hypothetical protein